MMEHMRVLQTNLRPELASHLTQRLKAFSEGFRHNLALIGPPGSGKTYQLQRILAQQPPLPLILIYCPLYQESARSFLRRFFCAILQAGGLAPQAANQDDARNQPMEALLESAEASLPTTAAAIRVAEGLLTRHLFGEAFNRALDAIPILAEERHQPCVLMLDEFLYLEELGFVHAFHELGKRVMIWPSTLFVLASSSPYRARLILRERLHLLFGQFELLTLEAADPSSAKAWVAQELRALRGVKALSPFLIHWLGSYPSYLGVFLKRLKELARLGGSCTELTEALFLQAAWDVLGGPESTLHHWCLSRTERLTRVRLGARATEALIHIAQGARTSTELSQRIGRAGLSGALQLLVEQDLAKRNGMCWVVSDPVLRCWLSTVLAAQRFDARSDSAEIRSRFEQHLRALWLRWIESAQLPLAGQVEALFTKFRDDTVSIDSKTGRLPRFERVTAQRPHSLGAGAYLVADGSGKRWCATVQEGLIDETVIANFETFCKAQTPKPSRKVVIAKEGLDDNARLLAKSVNMWVWGSGDLQSLMKLYEPI
jgi:hypothetical protein